ncbi:MAG: thiaminase II [Pseudomonadota bacterium]
MLFKRLKAENESVWQSYTRHPFVEAMGEGSLDRACFRHYLIQDYLFLIHFARAYALAVYKGKSLHDMRAALEGLKAILDVEMDLHVTLCGQWGLTAEDLEKAPESRATMAYTRYVLETGLRGDLLDLHVALSPCVIGYQEIAARLVALPSALAETNPYAPWIREYSGADYVGVADAARQTLDRLAGEHVSDQRFLELSRIFSQATRLEADFWQMGLDLAD